MKTLQAAPPPPSLPLFLPSDKESLDLKRIPMTDAFTTDAQFHIRINISEAFIIK